MIIFGTLLPITLFAAGSAFALSQKQVQMKEAKALTAVTIADKVNTDWNPFGWGSKGFSDAGLTDKVTANNEANLWGNFMLNFTNYDAIELEFSFDAYDNDEEANISNGSDAVDFYVKSTDNNTQYGMLRVWTKGWGAAVRADHPGVIYGSGWGQSTSTFIDEDGHSENSSIKGSFVSSSSIKIRISRTMGIEVGNSWDKYSHSSDASIIETTTNGLKSADAFSLVIGGDGGFARDLTVTLKTINGQSLANDGTYFLSDEDPEILVEDFDDEIDAYEQVNLPGAKAVDALDGVQSVKAYDGEEEFSGPLLVKTAGSKTITYKYEDASGNKVSKNIVYTVGAPTAASFASWLMGTHTDTCLNKYKEAKGVYNSLAAEEKEKFVPANYPEAVERYEAWCTANGDSDPYSSVIVEPSQNIKSAQNANNNIILVIIACTSLVTICGLLLLKKRKVR